MFIGKLRGSINFHWYIERQYKNSEFEIGQMNSEQIIF